MVATMLTVYLAGLAPAWLALLLFERRAVREPGERYAFGVIFASVIWPLTALYAMTYILLGVGRGDQS